MVFTCGRIGRGRTRFPWKLALTLVLTAPLIVVSWTGTAQSAKRGGTLTVALETDVHSFDVIKGGTYGLSGLMPANAIMEPLIEQNKNGGYVPVLAKSWKRSSDGKSYTFKLRGGVRFNDGKNFAAKDVVDHYKRILRAPKSSPLRTYLTALRDVQVVDRLTVRFKLRRPWPAFLQAISARSEFSLIPSHLAVKSGRQHRKPIGTGPFKFVSWTPAKSIVLARNEAYRIKGQPRLDRIVFRLIPDQADRFAALKKAKVDVIWSDIGDHIVRARKDRNIRTLTYDGSGGGVILLNTRKPPLDDPRVRQAVAHAWSQRLIINKVSRNKVPFVTDPFGARLRCGPGGYREHDLEKAKTLARRYGKPIRIEMIHTDSSRGELLGRTLQQLLKQAGISLRLTPMEQKRLQKAVLTGNYMVSPWIFREALDQGPQLAAFSSSKSTYNPTGVQNAELDELALSLTARTGVKRKNTLCRIAEIINDQALLLWRGGLRVHALTRADVKGVPPMKGRILLLHTAWLDR